MRITPKQYAESLHETVKNKKDSQVKDVIKKFVQILAANNDLSMTNKIIVEFSKIWNREQGIVEAEIVSARALDKSIVKLLNGYIAELSGVEKVVAEERVDKTVLGGVVIKYENKVLDGSLRSRLWHLRGVMEK